MKTIEEGSASIVVGEGVFYNPRMSVLRDISVSFLNSLGKGKKVIDCTSATGVRGIRYAIEAGAEVTFLDINEKAYANSKANIRRNKLKSRALNKSLQEYANTARETYDAIDLDPFGSPAPCMYDAMKLARSGTTLMATATDTAVLCGAPSFCMHKDLQLEAATQRALQGGRDKDTPALHTAKCSPVQYGNSSAALCLRHELHAGICKAGNRSKQSEGIVQVHGLRLLLQEVQVIFIFQRHRAFTQSGMQKLQWEGRNVRPDLDWGAAR